MNITIINDKTIVLKADGVQSFEAAKKASYKHFFGVESSLEMVGNGIFINHLFFYHVASIREGMFVACKHNLTPIQTRKMVGDCLK